MAEGVVALSCSVSLRVGDCKGSPFEIVGGVGDFCIIFGAGGGVACLVIGVRLCGFAYF